MSSPSPPHPPGKGLPILACGPAILGALDRADVLVLSGETGSGKSTQLPQLLLGRHPEAVIAISQPRRVAATSVAARVAAERGEPLGDVVGYAVRFDERCSQATQVRYATDGLLLREAVGDPMLSRYTHVLLDEVHERALATDVLVAVVKRAAILRRRPPGPAGKEGAADTAARPEPLKVVLMSATADVELLVRYFSAAPPPAVRDTPAADAAATPCPSAATSKALTAALPVATKKKKRPRPGSPLPVATPPPGSGLTVARYHVRGRQYPVSVFYAADPVADYLDAAVTAALQVHVDQPAPGDILVFLTGADEIDAAVELTRARAGRLLERSDARSLLPLPLYASLPPAAQARALLPLPPGQAVRRSLHGCRLCGGTEVVAADGVARQTAGDLIHDGSARANRDTGGSVADAGTICSECGGRVTAATTAALAAAATAAAGSSRGSTAVRKVIFSTNVAETSVTISGVRYVIDAGVAKSRTTTPSGADILRVAPISRAAAAQRAGRAGRQAPGVAYRLYSEAAWTRMAPRPVAELVGADLAPTVLSLLAMQVCGPRNDPTTFDYLQPPKTAAVTAALERLVGLGAVAVTAGSLEVTPMGAAMARLPVRPAHARALLEAVALDVTGPLLSAVALLAADGEVWVAGTAARATADASRRAFGHPTGDHLTLAAVLDAYAAAAGEGGEGPGPFCKRHALNARTLAAAMAVRAQLARLLDSIAKEEHWVGVAAAGGVLPGGAPAVAAMDPAERVRRCLAAGYVGAAATWRGGAVRAYVLLGGAKPVTAAVHPSSVLSAAALARGGGGGTTVGGEAAPVAQRPADDDGRGRRPRTVVFDELVITSKAYLRGVTAVESGWLVEHGGDYYRSVQA
ncbi:hypothetical protein MMPV_003235 [Pyropia vietnamensis]